MEPSSGWFWCSPRIPSPPGSQPTPGAQPWSLTRVRGPVPTCCGPAAGGAHGPAAAAASPACWWTVRSPAAGSPSVMSGSGTAPTREVGIGSFVSPAGALPSSHTHDLRPCHPRNLLTYLHPLSVSFTHSLIDPNIVVLSFCLVSGNSFSTCAWTMTPN